MTFPPSSQPAGNDQPPSRDTLEKEWKSSIAQGLVAALDPDGNMPSPAQTPEDVSDLLGKKSAGQSGAATCTVPGLPSPIIRTDGRPDYFADVAGPSTRNVSSSNTDLPVPGMTLTSTDNRDSAIISGSECGNGGAPVKDNNNNNADTAANDPDAIAPVNNNDGASDAIEIEHVKATDPTDPAGPAGPAGPIDCNGLDNHTRKWLRYGPAGFTIIDFAAFMKSGYAAKADRHHNYLVKHGVLPEVRYDVDDRADDQPEVALAGYNMSRSYDKVCPICYTWFHVGENVFATPDDFRKFRERSSENWASEKILDIQREGRCGLVCERVVNYAREVNRYANTRDYWRRVERVCKETTRRRRSGWRKCIPPWISKIPTVPEGVEVHPAPKIDRQRRIKIVFRAANQSNPIAEDR
ncbi:uncharacterized protein RSE6_12101 [Rhynchosporium secalis]|uniref:Uncharacterized protein n=1 Tax=Rhynchosporium secalis TaxID=38038 RepID=A0A1E1MPM1_RHYSE|nr:uncharacterized protein RSE6_12101 [Rhynchosporium secalis]